MASRSNQDLTDFIDYASWFVKPSDQVSFSQTIQGRDFFHLSVGFTNLFPVLSELLWNSRVTELQINHEPYQLLGWTDHQGESFGWLVKPPVTVVDKPLCPEHRTLLARFGGITERWNETEDSWLCNLNSALTYQEAEEGFQGWESYIEEVCSDEGVSCEIKPIDYIAFAFEANGNLTLYRKADSSVIMIAHDHCFEHITPLEGYPEYTVYTINGCSQFVTWVENVAKQEICRIN